MGHGLYAFALLAGCSFPNGQGSGVQDAPRIDAPAIDTSMIDVPMMMIDGAIDSPAQPADTDADGIPDATDNCPTVANANQRNHDGDAKGDACDACPHLASAIDPDGDLDGVGDACDPRPTTPGDSIALFEGFYDASSINAWTINGGSWSVANGVLSQTSTATNDVSLVVPGNITRAAVTTSAKVVGFGTPTGSPSSRAHVSVTAGVAFNQAYWCSIYDAFGTPDEIYATTTVAGNTNYPNTNWPGTFGVNSEMRLTVALIGTNNICTVVQGNVTASVMGNIGPTSGQVQVATRTAAANFDYLFVVAIGP